MSLELPRIRGRAAGACHGPPGRPKFTGTIDEEGRIRIDCDNYPEHWQEIQLPSQWVLAYQAHQEDLSDRLSPETLQNKVEVHADQAWTVDEADPGYAGLHRQLIASNIDRANACGESMYDVVQCILFGAVDLEPFVKERFTDQGFHDIDQVYEALDCGLLGKNKARYSLHPMLKVFGREEYIRADSKFKVVFRRSL